MPNAPFPDDRRPFKRQPLGLTPLAWFVLVVAAAIAGWRLAQWRDASAAAVSRVITPRGDLAADEKATIELFRNAAASVVFIATSQVRRDRFTLNPVEVPAGSGSGFVWDSAGHVVTNFHVIEGVGNSGAARVILSDQSTYPADVVGVAPDKDLAVLKIDAPADRLPALAIGTSHDLVVGQKVFAIGNPFGLDHTLTTGIISGLEREVRAVTGRPIQGVIQTDAAINPGNSGGPLLDSAGRLIGVNSAIVSPSGAYAGIGFAVPVDTVSRVVPQLVQHGRVIRPGLGVALASDEINQRLGLKGLLVASVTDGGGAAEAGVRPTRRSDDGRLLLGDIIKEIDGKPVDQTDDLYRALDRLEVGAKVELTLLRDRNQTVKLEVRLKPLPD